jgi:hypothetical protein
MSESGLGCVKTPKIRPKSDFLARSENSTSTKSMGYDRANSPSGRQNPQKASFHTGWVNNGRFWPSLKVSALPREQT